MKSIIGIRDDDDDDGDDDDEENTRKKHAKNLNHKLANSERCSRGKQYTAGL